jgi:hypothetical protein
MKRTIYLKMEVDWDDYDDVCNELILEDSGIYDSLKIGVSVEEFGLVSAELKPEKNKWVIGFVELQGGIFKKEEKPVIFQVRWNGRNWVDWCGDIDVDADWKVTHWIPLFKAVEDEILK